MNENIIIDGMLCLMGALRKERQKKLLVLLIIFFFAGGIGWVGYFKGIKLFYLLMLVGWSIGLFFSYSIFKQWNLKSTGLLYHINKHPQQIVWVYQIQLQMIPFGISFWKEVTLSVLTDDRTEYQIRAHKLDIFKIEQALQQLLPHATFGYSQERAQWYTASPLLLLKDPK